MTMLLRDPLLRGPQVCVHVSILLESAVSIVSALYGLCARYTDCMGVCEDCMRGIWIARVLAKSDRYGLQTKVHHIEWYSRFEDRETFWRRLDPDLSNLQDTSRIFETRLFRFSALESLSRINPDDAELSKTGPLQEW